MGDQAGVAICPGHLAADRMIVGDLDGRKTLLARPVMVEVRRLPLPLILTLASRLGMSVLRVARQLGAIGNFSQLFGSLPCEVGITPHLLRMFPQDSGCLAKVLGRRHASTLANGRHLSLRPAGDLTTLR